MSSAGIDMRLLKKPPKNVYGGSKPVPELQTIGAQYVKIEDLPTTNIGLAKAKTTKENAGAVYINVIEVDDASGEMVTRQLIEEVPTAMLMMSIPKVNKIKSLDICFTERSGVESFQAIKAYQAALLSVIKPEIEAKIRETTIAALGELPIFWFLPCNEDFINLHASVEQIGNLTKHDALAFDLHWRRVAWAPTTNKNGEQYIAVSLEAAVDIPDAAEMAKRMEE